ncbi:MAG: hypothetical protein SGI86_22355 [Deltaproteobacteria bacterium]|nr:hypothetical protein [Deltaproteobacteria bacterium]
MNFQELLDAVPWHGLFRVRDILPGRSEASLRVQLSRWVKAGKLQRLSGAAYAINKPFREPNMLHPFFVANFLFPETYISQESALAYYDMIPERIVSHLSITHGRPARRETPLGTFVTNHISAERAGLDEALVDRRQLVRIGTRERALLDLIWLVPKGESAAHLRSLRLQNLEALDFDKLTNLAGSSGKLNRAVTQIAEIKKQEEQGWTRLS